MTRRFIITDPTWGILVGVDKSTTCLFTCDAQDLMERGITKVTSFGQAQEAFDFISMCFSKEDSETLKVYGVEAKSEYVTNIELVKAGFASMASTLLISIPSPSGLLH